MTYTFHRSDATFSSVSSTDVTNITDIATAWTTFNSTAVTPAAGAFTATGFGRYKQIGKTVHLQLSVSITTNGTGSGNVRASLPVSPSAGSLYTLQGRASAVSGKQLQAIIDSSSCAILNYDGTYPGATDEILLLNGTYQSA